MSIITKCSQQSTDDRRLSITAHNASCGTLVWRRFVSFIKMMLWCILHSAQSNSFSTKVSTSFLLSHGPVAVQSLAPLTTRFRELYSTMNMSCNFQVTGLNRLDQWLVEGLAMQQYNIWEKRCIFTCDSIYARARICHSNSVCLSVCPSICLSHGWISQKRLKLGSRNFRHTIAPSL